MFELTQNPESNAVIKVVGVGGGGGNALEHMVAENIDGVEFICANTDAQALGKSNAKIHLRLGDELTKGLGAGADPRIGRQAAEEDKDPSHPAQYRRAHHGIGRRSREQSRRPRKRLERRSGHCH